MASPLLSLLTGRSAGRGVETVIPQRTFADVILPAETRRALDEALAQVRNHTLIFNRWGLGERHTTGLGLAFNFAGPPGTGKTICAEAIAHEEAGRWSDAHKEWQRVARVAVENGEGAPRIAGDCHGLSRPEG